MKLKTALKWLAILLVVGVVGAFIETLYYGPRPKDGASSIMNELGR